MFKNLRSIADSEPAVEQPGRAVNRILLARALRDFGDGFVAVLLPIYLITLGHTAFEVGIIATVALFGSAILTLLVARARYGLRPAHSAAHGVGTDDHQRHRLRRR
jgi:hypothetical protein